MLQLDLAGIEGFIQPESRRQLKPRLKAAHQAVLQESGAGAEFLGWRDLLLKPNDALLSDIETTAENIRIHADVFLCIGIGGSYLGAHAVIDALSPYFNRQGPEILFAGHHMSGQYLQDLLQYLEGKSVYVNVISKSGTTLEPALAFRAIRGWLEQNFEDANQRITITTDPAKGALNALGQKKGYKKYEIPSDVGGRFSVLTPVGLLPIAVAGIDIRSMFYGAVSACRAYEPAEDNPALAYAGTRYLLLQQGYPIEVLATFEPRLHALGGWWQQLFGESEGKEKKGIFPTAVQYSTDLHSLGQYMQDGQRIVMETFLMLRHDGGENVVVMKDPKNLDGLNYLAGQSLSFANHKAYEGTREAHRQGGVPTLTLWLDALTPEAIGESIYFFEHAVAVGGYLLGVNPFNQPGVEAYKREMFARMGRPNKR